MSIDPDSPNESVVEFSGIDRIRNSPIEDVQSLSRNSNKFGLGRLEFMRPMDTQLVWMIVLPATAECIVAEVIPPMTTEAGLDLASTLANIFGAYLEGAIYAVERETSSSGTKQLCSIFRLWYLNVFTSFPFVAVHGAEIAVHHGLPQGFGFVASAMVLSVICFEAGRMPMESMLINRAASGSANDWTHEIGTTKSRHRILFSMIIFIFFTLARTNWRLTQALMLQSDFDAVVAKGTSTIVGIIFSVAGVFTGSRVNTTLQANALSCFLVAAGFILVRLLFGQLEDARSEMILAKFAGSFCGALSGFASMLSDMGRLHHDQKPREAMNGLLCNVGISAVFVVLFYIFDRHGWEIYAHPLGLDAKIDQ